MFLLCAPRINSAEYGKGLIVMVQILCTSSGAQADSAGTSKAPSLGKRLPLSFDQWVRYRHDEQVFLRFALRTADSGVLPPDKGSSEP